MKGLTEELPKPMLPLNGRPILAHVKERLQQAGFREFAIVTGYRAETIEDYFAGQAVFLRQMLIDGTASAAGLARDFVGADDFLLTFGDILSDSADYRAMAERLDHDPKALAVAAVRHVPDPWQGAAVYETGGIITRIVEKPAPGTSSTNWNSAGIYCLRASVFDDLAAVSRSPRGEFELTSAIEALASRGRVWIHALEGVWRDIGRPEDLAAAEAETRSAR